MGTHAEAHSSLGAVREAVDLTRGTNTFQFRAADVTANGVDASVQFEYRDSWGPWLIIAIVLFCSAIIVGGDRCDDLLARGKGPI